MLTNSLSNENLQLTIIRHPLTVSPEILLLDVVALINQTQSHFGNSPIKDLQSLEDSTKEIGNITPEADSCVLVMENSQLVGIFTQRDLIKLTAEGKSLENISVGEVMTRELVTLEIGEFKDVFTALNLLKQHRIRHLPILGQKGEVIGLITPASLLAVAIQQAGLYNYARVKLAERQRIETELRLERNFVSAVLNIADALVIVLDCQGRIVRFNHTCEQTTGYFFDEVKGKFIWDILLLPEKVECIKAIFQRLAHRELPNRYETYLVSKDSDRHFISWSNNVLLNRDDQVEYIVCTGINITESRKAQEELQQTRNFLQSMINNLPVAVFVKDAKPENCGTFKLWNQTCERIFGITAEQAIGKTDYEFFPKEQADFFRQKDQEAFSSGIPQDISEELIDSPRFGQRILHTTKIPLYDKNQQPEYLLCISEDITEHKQAKENLQQAKEQLQTVLDAVPGFVSWVSTDGYYLGVNRHLAESFNFTSDAFVGEELGFMQNSQQFTEFMRDFLARQDVADSRVIDTQINGKIRNYLLVAQKYQQNTAAVVVGIDITERKQAEIALAKSESMLRSLLNSTPNIVTMVNREGKILFINQKIPSLSVEEVIGRNIDDYVFSDDCHIQRSALEYVFNHGEVVSYEIRALETNAPFTYYDCQAGPIWRDGQVTDAVIVLNNVSERKQAEAALRESEQKFRLITENIRSTFWITDIRRDTRQIVYVSPAFEEIWGRSTEEAYASSDTFLEAIHPSDRQRFIADTPKRTQGEYDEEYRIVRPDGAIRWIRSRAFPIKNDNKEVYRITGIAEDITERKQAEIALQSLVESTASTTGHDFFPALVEYIASALDVRHALVTELIDGQIQTLGFWSDGELQPNICYEPTSTPCEILLKQGSYYSCSEIQELFPTDEKWAGMKAESSMGVVLSDDFGNPIGSLCIVDKKPIDQPDRFEGILKVFAARASAELQRKRAQEALQQLNRDLEARVEQRTLELQESEAELRAIFNQAAVGIKLETLDGRFLKVNQKLCEILGYSQEDLLNKTYMDITYLDDVQGHINNLQKLISGDVETFSIEKRCLHKNGNLIWLNLTCSLIRDVTGKPIYSIGIVKDIQNQKQAEQELKRQLAAVEAAIDGIAILSQDNYIYLNKAHVEMFSYASANELIGKPWTEIYEPDEINRFQTRVFPILMQQKHWRGEAISKRKDGTFFDQEVSLTISEQGDLICVARDITQRKESERLINEQRAFLRSIIDNNPNCIFVKDREDKFLLVNQAMADFHNTTIQEFVGKTDAEFYADVELEQLKNSDKIVLTTLKPIQMLKSSTRKATGEKCYFQSIKVPLIAPNGEVRGILGVATDITERKLAQDALQQQIERERLVNVITQRIRESLDLQATLNVTVAEIHKLLKVDRVLIYRTLTDGTGKVIAEALRPGYESILDQSFPVECFPNECYSRYVNGEIYALSDRNLRKSPSCLIQFMEDMQIRAKLVIPIIQHDVLWGLLIAHQCSHPREWKSGEIELLQQLANQLAIATQQSGLYAQLQVELNERKKAEEQICKALEKEKELSDLKSRFISMTSHEFRTPLAVIASSAGILKSFRHKLDEQQKQKHLQCIQTYVQHTTQLLDDILLINKAEAGKLAFDPSYFDLLAFCHSLIDELQLSSPNHNLVFSPQYLGSSSNNNSFIAYMDNKLLQQILSNLLSNAVKYSSIGSNIQIDLLIQAKLAVFLIKDEGIGISLEDQQHLFESFYRGSNIGNTPGTGLGLTIITKCVYLHEGRITFASQIGVGTTFRVELPLIASKSFI